MYKGNGELGKEQTQTGAEKERTQRKKEKKLLLTVT
jgi:hypothetical protein